MSHVAATHILTFTCRGATGQVARFSALLDRQGCYIDELAVFDDSLNGRFFVRCMFHPVKPGFEPATLKAGMDEMSQHDDLSWQLHHREDKAKVLIMVSKLDHCLNDLLYRWRIGDLDMDVVAIASNHQDLAPIAASYGIPFHHLPITADTKPQQEQALWELIQHYGAELVVLARYMQVLSHEMSVKLSGKAINIHHSFLPGFKGARPYHQAHTRGVKLIGATAHYITDDLDEGPIIEQVVDRVDHAFTPEDLQATGRDMECLALSRAVRYHLEHRVFLNDSCTVVLK